MIYCIVFRNLFDFGDGHYLRLSGDDGHCSQFLLQRSHTHRSPAMDTNVSKNKTFLSHGCYTFSTFHYVPFWIQKHLIIWSNNLIKFSGTVQNLTRHLTVWHNQKSCHFVINSVFLFKNKIIPNSSNWRNFFTMLYIIKPEKSVDVKCAFKILNWVLILSIFNILKAAFSH